MVEIKNLVRRFGNKYAVDDISFTIGEGEIVGFLGPNGAGKSTTMNMITGYLSPTSGTIVIDGKDVFEEPIEAKKKIGFLPEQPPLYMDMTVGEYLSFVFDLKGCDFNKSEHLKEVCELVKVSDVKDRLIKNLSKGYKQRVGIAGAIIGNPKFMIFDEPTVGLDPKQIIEIRNLIRGLGKKHTVILSSHILSEVQAICDRIIIINQGKIIADERTTKLNAVLGQGSRFKVKVCGPCKEVQNLISKIHGVNKVTTDGIKDGDAYTFIVDHSASIDVRKMVFRSLAERSWPILALEGVEATLEELFVKFIDGKGGIE